MNTRYNAADIEVLSGLDPVKRRPGMYTDTTRPNHLAQEVIDNAVDEALAGHASRIDVILHTDGSCEVADDGRGMPVDIHPKDKVSGVELILTRLHAVIALFCNASRPHFRLTFSRNKSQAARRRPSRAMGPSAVSSI